MHSPAHGSDHGKMTPTSMGLSWMEQRKLGALGFDSSFIRTGLVGLPPDHELPPYLFFFGFDCNSPPPPLLVSVRWGVSCGETGAVVSSRSLLLLSGWEPLSGRRPRLCAGWVSDHIMCLCLDCVSFREFKIIKTFIGYDENMHCWIKWFFFSVQMFLTVSLSHVLFVRLT